MARTRKTLPQKIDIAHLISAGMLARVCPCVLIDEVLVKTGKASQSAISQARTRLGPEVMKQLADWVLRPLARPGAPGGWYRGWRLMAVDGSCMDVADETANAKHFGYPVRHGDKARSRRHA